MKSDSQSLPQHIITAFIKELEAFKHGDYKFNNGSDKELFEGTQREAFDKYLEGVKGNVTKGYWEIPTGVGKTPMFIAVIRCYLKAIDALCTQGIIKNRDDAPKVLIHEPTNDLVDQTALAFVDFMPDIARVMEGQDDHGRKLDYANSAIRIKGKDTKSNPDIRITTYQGQAADERKVEKAVDKPAALEKRKYKPERYGLIIHDEAHALTAPKFGQAVDKFPDAIQLGVTATPEYSKEKTVATKLEHCYFDLPIDEAQRRGDLCPARPVLIKTRRTSADAIRLEKARKFYEQQRCRPLTKGQLEQLYNQEARNKAIIKAYLTGEHPDTGKAYGDMTGMIFAGGIVHCNDFIIHADKVLNQPAYHEIKNWLRDEGLCLIAPIHSGIPKDGVVITIGGKKRKCTKDEIKELHRQGKVRLLISDQELKVGSDFPADEFGAETVDRFSVVDAGQRTGRLLRLDRGNVRYGRYPNPNKDSVLLNVIDETTHEMHKGTPHYPIHAVEVLRGAEHRPPIRRKGAITRFIPQVHETEEQLGFEFVTDLEVIRDTAERLRAGKKKPLPDKDENWLVAPETTDSKKVIGGGRAPIRKVVKYLIGDSSPYDSVKLGIQEIECNGQFIRVQKMQSGFNRQPLCLCRDDWSKVEKAAGVEPGVALPKKEKNDENWLAPSDTVDLPGGNRDPIRAAVTDLTGKSSKYDSKKLGIQAIKYKGQFIRLQKMQSGTAQVICIYRQDWPKVEKAARVKPMSMAVLPDKDSNWLSLKDTTDAEDLPGCNRGPIQAVVKALIGDSSPYDSKKLGIQTIKYKGEYFCLQKMQSSHNQPICLFRDDWSKVEKVAGVEVGGILPDKDPEKWLSSSDTEDSEKVPGGYRRPVREVVQYLTGKSSPYDSVKLGIQTIEYKGEHFQLQKMQSGAKQPICIYREDWSKVEKVAGVEPVYADEGLKSKPITKKETNPGGKDLKRKGRSRTIADDDT